MKRNDTHLLTRFRRNLPSRWKHLSSENSATFLRMATDTCVNWLFVWRRRTLLLGGKFREIYSLRYVGSLMCVGNAVRPSWIYGSVHRDPTLFITLILQFILLLWSSTRIQHPFVSIDAKSWDGRSTLCNVINATFCWNWKLSSKSCAIVQIPYSYGSLPSLEILSFSLFASYRFLMNKDRIHGRGASYGRRVAPCPERAA